MAATVESAFILIDRASGPIRGIRRELRGLEVDAQRAGGALDALSGPRAARQLEMTARETKTFGGEVRATSRELDGAERNMGRFQSRTRGTHRDLIRLGAEIRSVGTLLRLLRWPVLIAGAGGAAQALGGLAGGATALVPKLLNVGGAAVSAGTFVSGMGAAMVVTKLATADLSQALGGNEQALKRLTPEGRAFLQVLRDFQPEVDRMRRSAQRGLFPGLGDALSDVRSQAPALRKIIGQTSGDLGNLARFGGRQVAAPGFMRELATLSDQGARALGAGARSGFYFAEAIEHVLVAGGPFTDWLGNSIEKFAKWTEHEAKVAQETGKLDDYFVEVKQDLKLMLDVGDHVFHALGGLMDAATGQGDDLWKSIDRGAKRWDEWSNSFEGQMAMRRWFDDVRPALSETVGLVGDLGEALGELSSGPEGAQMLHSLRETLPDVVGGVQDLTSTLGPAAIEAIGSGVELLGNLASEAGPLTLVARSVGAVAETLNALVKALGPAGPALASFAGTALLLRRVGLVGGGSSGGAVGGLLPLGGGRGGAAAGGGMSATEMALLAGGGAAAGARLGGSLGARAIGGGLTQTASGLILPAGVSPIEAAAAANGGAGRIARGAARVRGAASAGWGTMTAAGGASRFAGGAGRFVWPVALASGVLGALGTDGGIGARAQGAASATTFGIVPRPISDAERESAGGKYAGNVIDHLTRHEALDPRTGSLGGQRQSIAGLRRTIKTLPGDDTFDQTKGDLKQATDLLRVELKRREDMLRQSEQAHRNSLRSRSVEHAQTMFDDFTHAFEIRAKHGGPEAAMDRMTSGMLHRLQKMNPAGRKVLADSTLAWAREQARLNPALKDEYDDLVRGVESRFSRMGRHVQVVNGQVLTGSQTEWRNIKVAITSQTEKARQEASDDFTAIQLQAIGSLTAMGYTPAEAKALVKGIESGKYTAKQAGQLTGAGQPALQSQSNLAKSHGAPGLGDGIGDGPGGRPGAQQAIRAGAGGAGLMGAKPGMARYDAEARKYGLHVSSGLRPGAITASGNPSLHGSGDAIDETGSASGMLAYAMHLAQSVGSGLDELIHTPLGFGIKNGRRVPLSFWGPTINAMHRDHVHVGDRSPGGGAGLGGGLGGRISLHGRRSRLGGVPGALATEASTAIAAGLQGKLNEALGSIGGDMPGMGPGAALAGGGGAAEALRAQFGLPSIFDAIRGAESDGRVDAHNQSGASGWYQIMMPLHAGLIARLARQLHRPNDPFDPVVNTAAAAELYRESGTAPWVSSRGVWGGKGDGIGADVSRPSMFGAGGPERVTVAMEGGRGGGSVHVNEGAVLIHGGGASVARIRRVVHRELERFAEAVHTEITDGREESEAGVL